MRDGLTFLGWLRAQRKRQDPVGDFARDWFTGSREGCCRARSPDGVMRHIRVSRESLTITRFAGVSNQTVITHAVIVRSEDRNVAATHTVLGLALAASGQPADGEKSLRQSVALAPNNLEAWNNFATTLANNRKHLADASRHLRTKMIQSPLLDHRAQSERFAIALRQLWEQRSASA